MDKFWEFFYTTFEKEDYPKAMEIATVLLILFAPSISIIFLYKRELFMTLDITKLLLIGVVANVIFFYIIYTSLRIFNNLELAYSVCKISDLGKEILELSKEVIDVKNSDNENINELKKEVIKASEKFFAIKEPIKSYNIKMIKLSVDYVVILTILIWGLYLWDYMLNQNINSDLAIKRIAFYIIFICLIHIFKMLFGIKEYVSKIREPYKNLNGKNYKIFKDKNILTTIVTAIVYGSVSIQIIISYLK